MALGLESLTGYTGVPTSLLIVAIAWTIAWDGLALWKSARLRQPIWFILILLINTLGILEILYLFIFSEMNLSKPARKQKKAKRPSRKKRR